MYVFRLLYVHPDTRKQVVAHYETENFIELVSEMRLHFNACADVFEKLAFEKTDTDVEFMLYTKGKKGVK